MPTRAILRLERLYVVVKEAGANPAPGLTAATLTLGLFMPRNRYSALRLTLFQMAISVPPPTAKPEFVRLEFPTKQGSAPVQMNPVPPELALTVGRVRLALSSTRANANPPVPYRSQLSATSQPSRALTVPMPLMF